MAQLSAFFEHYNLLKTLILIVVLTLLLLYFLWWPGCLIAAVIGGFFVRGFSRAALVGFLAGLIAWGLLVGARIAMGAMSSIVLFATVAGLESIAGVLVVVIILIGGLLGLAGCLLGNTIYTLAEPYITTGKARPVARTPPKKKAPKKSAR
jgi:hypothetical protein